MIWSSSRDVDTQVEELQEKRHQNKNHCNTRRDRSERKRVRESTFDREQVYHRPLKNDVALLFSEFAK